MNTKRKIEELARLDGWKEPAYINYIWVAYPPDCPAYPKGSVWSINKQQVPSYLTSYNAIIPLVVKWCEKHSWTRFAESLGLKFEGYFPQEIVKYLFTKTPEQLADALIKAAGEWKD